MAPRDVDARSTPELLAAALAGEQEGDDETAWDAIRALHLRDDQAVFDAACALLPSAVAQERARAADILAQWGSPAPTAEQRRACADVLLHGFAREQDPRVLSSMGVALGHLEDSRAIAPLVAHKDHPHEDVRMGVVIGLLPHADPAAIDALIQLSSDVDADVRDWATFALGSGHEDLDTPALREALVRRLDDANEEVRCEALRGLALRRDARVIEPLRRELARPDVLHLAVEAAGSLGEPSFLPVLRELRASPDSTDPQFLAYVDHAIAALTASA